MTDLDYVVSIPPEKALAIYSCLKHEARRTGLDGLRFWGVIQVDNGEDYYVLVDDCYELEGSKYSHSYSYLGSQDGVKWFLIPDVDSATCELCRQLNSSFVGDVSKIYRFPVQAEGDEAEESEVGVTELQRLRYTIDRISSDTDIVPKGSEMRAVSGKYIDNAQFKEVKWPEALDSYIHRADGRGLRPLTWTLRCDLYRGRTVLRSLVWLGYVFVYDHAKRSWGGAYCGDGVHNDDFAFMI